MKNYEKPTIALTLYEEEIFMDLFLSKDEDFDDEGDWN
jgi:hypothetical protein